VLQALECLEIDDHLAAGCEAHPGLR